MMTRRNRHLYTQLLPHANSEGTNQSQDDILDYRRTEMNTTSTRNSRAVTTDGVNGVNGANGNVGADGAAGVDGVTGVIDGETTNPPLST